jgi:hypothetical protein
MKFSRRRFLTHALGTSLVGLTGYTSFRQFVPSLPEINIDFPGKNLGHALRRASITLPKNIPTIHTNIAIIGSGAAALTVAWQLSREGRNDYMLLEGPEHNGNNRGEIQYGVPYPTGAHYLPLPSVESTHIQQLLTDLKLYHNGDYDELAMIQIPSERLFYQQHWQEGFLPENDLDSKRFFQFVHQTSNLRGQDAKRLFAIPLVSSSDDNQWRILEKITFAQWLQQHGYRSTTLLWYLDYCCRDDYGQGINQVSAWAGLHYFCARDNQQSKHGTVLSWPDGLNELSRRMRQFCQLQPAQHWPTSVQQQLPIALNASALSINEHDTGVRILMQTAHGECYWLEANHAVCAMPLYIAAYVVKNIAQYGFDPTKHMPAYAPWIVGNFLIRGLPPEVSGIPLSWDNVLYQGKGLGYVVATHQQIRQGPPAYTSFTTYTALNHDTPTNIRRWMLKASPTEIYAQVATELESIYGVKLRSQVLQARLTLRGHAMAVPQPGYLSNQGLLALRNHHSRLHFAHSDLSGFSIFEEASYWGMQAAAHILRF